MKISRRATIKFVLLASLSLGAEARLGKATGGSNANNKRVLQLVELEGFGGDPSDNDLPLGLCQGDCDDDTDCEEGLVCFQRNPGEAIPGCLDGESEMSQTDFCVLADSGVSFSGNTTSSAPTSTPTVIPTVEPTEMPLVALVEDEDEEDGNDEDARDIPEAEFVGNNGDLTDKLQLCESDCDIDADCADGLICYQREKDQPIPGCLGEDSSRNDYCILATDVGSTTSVAPSVSPIEVEAPIVGGNATTEDDTDFVEDEDTTTTSPTTAATSNGGQASVSMTASPTTTTTSNGGQASVSMTSSPTALATNFAALPTKFPTVSPTSVPTVVVTVAANFAALPTKFPSVPPTAEPTDIPTGTPTLAPTASPTGSPTQSPTRAPTSSPTEAPTPSPTKSPSSTPTEPPTAVPTPSPTVSPTRAPTVPPTAPPRAPEEDSDFPVEDEEVMDDDGAPEAVLLGNNNDPAFFPLGKCQGDCDNNDECAEGLICFQRRNEEVIPGCSTPDSELYGIDFCVDPADFPEGEVSNSNTMVTTTGALVVSSSVNTSTKPARTKPTVLQVQVLPTLELAANNEGERLGLCQGDCDIDDDCMPGLVCFERNDRREVPGCSTTGIYGADYCIKDPNAAAAPVEELPTSSPTVESTSGGTSMQTSLGSI